MHPGVRTLAIVGTLLAFAAPASRAQKASNAADEKEVASYRLTMQSVQKFRKVVQAMAELSKTDPQLQAQMKLQSEIESLRSKDERTAAEQARLDKLEEQLEKAEKALDLSDASLTEMAEQIARMPAAAAALRQGGMTAREYIVFALAMFQASGFAHLKKSGLVKELPKDVSAENVKFVEEHAAELKALQEELDKINKQFEPVKKGS